MDEITVNSLSMLTSYGALGIVALYFMVKDWTITKKLDDTLSDFKIALETFLKIKGDE